MLVSRNPTNDHPDTTQIELWDLADLRSPHLVWSAPSGAFNSMTFDAASGRMAVYTRPLHGPGRIEVWDDVTHQQPRWTIPVTNTEDVIPGDTFLLAAGGERVVLGSGSTGGPMGTSAQLDMWTVANPEKAPVEVETGQTGEITSLALRPDGAEMAAGADDGTIQLVRITADALTNVGPAFTDLSSGYGPGAVIPDHRQGVSGHPATAVEATEFSPDGNALVTAEGGHTRFWSLDATALSGRICGTVGATIDPTIWARTIPSLAYRRVC